MEILWEKVEAYCLSSSIIKDDDKPRWFHFNKFWTDIHFGDKMIHLEFENGGDNHDNEKVWLYLANCDGLSCDDMIQLWNSVGDDSCANAEYFNDEKINNENLPALVDALRQIYEDVRSENAWLLDDMRDRFDDNGINDQMPAYVNHVLSSLKVINKWTPR